MKIKHTPYLFYLTLTAIILLTTGCSHESDPIEISLTGPLSIKIRLEADNFQTRSEEDLLLSDSHEYPEERFIDNEDIYVGLYDNEGRLIDVIFDSAGLGEKEASGYEDVDGVKTSFPQELLSGGKIVALANFKKFIENHDFSTLENLKKTTYNYVNSEGNQSAVTPLPMYGELDITAELLLRNYVDSGEAVIDLVIPVSRIFAKIRIVDIIDENIELKSAVLDRYNLEGLVAPSLSETSSVKTSVSGSFAGRDLGFIKKTGSEGNTEFYAYVPETFLGDEDEDPTRHISLVFSDGDKEYSGSLWLVTYDGGKPDWETGKESRKILASNRCYDYTIRSFTPTPGGDTDVEISNSDYIRIVYQSTGHGRFSSSDYPYINFSIDHAQLIRERGFLFRHSPSDMFRYYDDGDWLEDCYYIELTPEDLKEISDFDALEYQLFDREVPYEIEPELFINLMKDKQKIQISEDASGIRWKNIWLNTPTYNYAGNFVQKADKLKICWRSVKPVTEAYINDDWYSDFIFDAKRGSYYLEIDLTNPRYNLMTGILVELYIDSRNTIYEDMMDYRDIFIPEDEPDTYVFYVN